MKIKKRTGFPRVYTLVVVEPVGGKLNLSAESQSEDHGGDGGGMGLCYSRSERQDDKDIYRAAPSN